MKPFEFYLRNEMRCNKKNMEYDIEMLLFAWIMQKNSNETKR